MKRMTTIGIVMMTLLFFTSCKKEMSTNVDKDRIYTTYDVSYDQNLNRTDIKATFRVDHASGQKIELVYPSRVHFDGDRMVYRELMGSYEASRSGNVTGRSLMYVDGDGSEFINSQDISPIDLPFGLGSISKNGDFFLPWTGVALQAGETINVSINGGDQVVSRKFTTSVAGSTYIILSRYELQNLSAGTAHIQISREKESALSSASLSGGRIRTEYKSRKVTIQITE